MTSAKLTPSPTCPHLVLGYGIESTQPLYHYPLWTSNVYPSIALLDLHDRLDLALRLPERPPRVGALLEATSAQQRAVPRRRRTHRQPQHDDSSRV